MRSSILFMIESDPRTSPRPAEAIRIAAGIGTWQRTDVSVYFRDAAVLSLAEHTDPWVDEDNFTRYLPILAEWGRPIYVQSGAPLPRELGTAPHAFCEIDDSELAVLAARQTYVARF